MSVLSIFCDEAGDFGSDSSHYVVSFVLHDQDDDITTMLTKLADELRLGESGMSVDRAIHTGPAIRGENEYRGLPIEALLRVKSEDHSLSRSDLYFFESRQRLRRDYLGKLDHKQFTRRNA